MTFKFYNEDEGKNEFVGLGESDASEEITGAEIQGGTPQVESDDVQNHESSEMKNDVTIQR